MFCRLRKSSAMGTLAAALCMVMFVYTSAFAADDGRSAEEQTAIDSLNALLEQAYEEGPPEGLKADVALIKRVYDTGAVPVIVRLRDGDLPYGFCPVHTVRVSGPGQDISFLSGR
jgi:hypothetical protein